MDKAFDRTSLYKTAMTIFVILIVWKIINKLTAVNNEGFSSVQQFSPEMISDNGKLKVAQPTEKPASGSEQHAPQVCGMPNNFFFKKNRYLMDGRSDKTKTYYTVNEEQTGENIGDFDWSVPHESGPNNTYGDLLWHYTSPRMILQDNCMRCNEFGPKSNHNVPNGIGSSFTAQYDDNFEDGLDKVNGTMLYDNLGLPDFTTGGQGTVSGTMPVKEEYPPQHVMSPPPGNGLVPAQTDCVLGKVHDPNRCGCDGFGKIFNFH
jgi:hypothetical protein